MMVSVFVFVQATDRTEFRDLKLVSASNVHETQLRYVVASESKLCSFIACIDLFISSNNHDCMLQMN